MKIVVLDSASTTVPGVIKGPGSPAYFSRHTIAHLREAAHNVTIASGFDEALCAPADAVWAEWCNEEAYKAAQSGACKRLVIRMRGYDVWGPLAQVRWENVDAIVYESAFLRTLAEERLPALKAFRSHVIPGGINLDAIPYRTRRHGSVVALVARAVADKGYQLAFEWARQRPDIQLHVATAFAESNSTLMRYLHHTRPDNVTIHGTVDTIKWLDEIDANYLLSASNWESLGYTIIEAMAMGIKPLIHDTPGAAPNFGEQFVWRSLDHLNERCNEMAGYDSSAYRDVVLDRFDARTNSAAFADVLFSSVPRDVAPMMADLKQLTYEHANKVFGAVRTAIERPSNMNAVEALVEDFRARLDPHSVSATHRYGAAMATSVAFFNHADLARAELWACRALLDFARPDAMAMLGQVACARGDEEAALQWYKAACAVDDTPNRYRFPDLVDGREAKKAEIEAGLSVSLPPAPPPDHYVVIVTVRNAEPWIDRCLASIASQTVSNFRCVVVDDVSTDLTATIAQSFTKHDQRFTVVKNTDRLWQARNTFEAARRYASDEDVVILLDGDDWLARDTAFEVIRDAYVGGAWATYGNIVESDGSPSRFGVYPRNIARTGKFAEWPWCATTPRTFRSFLLNGLREEDFTLDGAWPKFAGDVCVFLPILQRACERAVGITEAIYVYNADTPLSDHKVDPYEAVRTRDALLDRPQQPRMERP
jgi:hypothetical protein